MMVCERCWRSKYGSKERERGNGTDGKELEREQVKGRDVEEVGVKRRG